MNVNRYTCKLLLAIVMTMLSEAAFGQNALTLDQAMSAALQNNQGLKASEYEVGYYQALRKSATDIGKLSVSWMHGQYNSVYQDNNVAIQQTLPFPGTLMAQSRLSTEQIAGARRNFAASRNELMLEVKTAYFQLLYLNAFNKVLRSQDSLYSNFSRISAIRYKTGESNFLEKTTAETQLLETRNQLLQNEADINIAQTHLQYLMKSELPVAAAGNLYKMPLPEDSASILHNPQLAYLRQQIVIDDQMKKVERSRIMPDVTVGYFGQSLVGYQNITGQDQYYGRSKVFQGFQLGIAIPLWVAPQLGRIKAVGIQQEIHRKTAEYYETSLAGNYSQAVQTYQKNLAGLQYYETSALQNAALILRQADLAYTRGEIGYLEYLQALKTALTIRSGYLSMLNQYNQSVIKIEYLLGNI